MAFVCLNCSAEYTQATRFCPACVHMDCVVLAPVKRKAAAFAEAEVASSRELVKRSWSLVDVSAVCPGLRLQRGAFVTVTGAPGAGKSTLAAALANATETPVVHLSAEERLGASVSERLARLGIRRDDYLLVSRAAVDDLVSLCRDIGAMVLVVDSLQATSFSPSDIRGFINKLGLFMAIVTSQVTKQNLIRGTRETEHEADVVLTIESGAWQLTKSRYQGTGLKGKVTFDVAGLARSNDGKNVPLPNAGNVFLRALPGDDGGPTDG